MIKKTTMPFSFRLHKPQPKTPTEWLDSLVQAQAVLHGTIMFDPMFKQHADRQGDVVSRIITLQKKERVAKGAVTQEEVLQAINLFVKTYDDLAADFQHQKKVPLNFSDRDIEQALVWLKGLVDYNKYLTADEGTKSVFGLR
jgi:hypothetical protein